MRPALRVAATELHRRLRDRSALLLVFVAPVALAVVISLAFGAGDAPLTATVALAGDGDELPPSYRQDLLSPLVDNGVLTVTEVADGGAVRAALAGGEADVGVVLPAAPSAATAEPGPTGEILVLRRADRRLAGDLLQALSQRFAARTGGLRAAAGDGASADPGAAQRAAAAAGARLAVVDADAGEGLAAASYFGPSMALLFVMLTLSNVPKSLLADRDGGQLARVRAAPIPAWSVPAGKALAAAVLALASIAVVWAVSVVGFGATWGDPLAVAALSAVTVAAFGALAALIAAVARTPAQADGLGMIVTFGLGLVAGHFFALHQMPPALQTVALATPNGWALRAFTDLAADGAGLVDIAPALGAIAGLGAAIGAVAAGLLRWRAP